METIRQRLVFIVTPAMVLYKLLSCFNLRVHFLWVTCAGPGFLLQDLRGYSLKPALEASGFWVCYYIEKDIDIQYSQVWWALVMDILIRFFYNSSVSLSLIVSVFTCFSSSLQPLLISSLFSLIYFFSFPPR